MPHTRRRTLTRLATTTAAAALLAASATGVASAQSSEGFIGSAAHDPTATRATTQHDNLTVTHEIIGSNVGFFLDTVHYRTTISATGGPARQITRIDETILDDGGFGCAGWTSEQSGTVTVTNQAGEHVTDSEGAWTVDPAAGTTVVFDSVHQLQYAHPAYHAGGLDGAGSCPQHLPVNMDAEVSIDVDGLDTLNWSPTGVTLTCALDCVFPGTLAGSVESIGS